jgi:hypothetical protein
MSVVVMLRGIWLCEGFTRTPLSHGEKPPQMLACDTMRPSDVKVVKVYTISKAME